MKKYIALLLCVILLVGVTACGKDTPKDTDTTASSTTQSTVTTTVGEGSTTVTTATTGTAGTATTTTATVTPPTGGTAAPTGTGTSTPSVTAPTKTPSSATGSQPTASGSKPSASTPTTGTTKPAEPSVILPAIGSDVDVTNGKNRIRVSAASQEYNADGTVAVSLTFKNYTSNWITEETDWVEYTCYGADGSVVQNATRINLGCIDTKRHPTKTFRFNVPADTTEVRLTRSKIVYWTEWS